MCPAKRFRFAIPGSSAAAFALAVSLALSMPASLTAQPVRTEGPPKISGGAASALMHARHAARKVSGTPAGLSLPAPSIDPLRVTRAFESYIFDDDPALNDGFVFIPPDPIGAAGPSHLVAVGNSLIEVRSKTGNLLWRDSLAHFFNIENIPFDPKVIYDRHRNRFVVVALELALFPDVSRILLAVSKDSTPAGGGSAHWRFHKINAITEISGFGDFFADYPGFEVDEEAVYITANLFSFDTFEDGGVRLWIVAKNGFYNGGTVVVKKRDPYAAAGLPVTTMPAEINGSNGAGPGIGTYLVSYSGVTDGIDEFVQVIRVDNPLGTPSFTHQFVNIGNIERLEDFLPAAPQKGSGVGIEVNDRRALDAVWWNNQLWLTTTIDPRRGPNEGQATAHWFKLNTSAVPGGPITLADQGDIGGEDIASKTSTFFPAIAISENGFVKIGFSASAKSIFAGAFVTGRGPGDAAGTVRGSEIVKLGLASYVRTFGIQNRWGDYSGISVDPLNSGFFWVFNQYADTHGSPTTDPNENGRWGTAWAQVEAK